ncbi:DUF3080 family protein [Vibrio zhugei]|uniref:DUF3080 family protein n=1 Tax=Vibrio zhugei TaxID=2479546 RepID=A0ABV7CC01_9VIBR|nr:DUF3080 family protein [Vibrio zhugei]
MKLCIRVMIGFLALLISACQWNTGSSIDNQFNTYLQRIANVQNVSSLSSPSFHSKPLPSKRQLHHPIPSVSLGLLDSYQFRQCDLFHLIANRNSILGKVQDAFRNLDYQLQILHGLHQCGQNTKLSTQFRKQIQVLALVKQEHIIQHWQNFLYTSDVMRRQFTPQRWYKEQRNYGHTRAALTQLNHIHRWIAARDWQHAPPTITSYQETLDKHPLIGDLRYSMQHATQWLTVITRQLRSNDAQIWCGRHADKTRLEHLRNVFQRFFIGEIQPYLSRIDGAYLDIEPQLSLLSPLSPDSAPTYTLPIVTTHRQFRHAISAHIQYWQDLFKRCSIAVGQNH